MVIKQGKRYRKDFGDAGGREALGRRVRGWLGKTKRGNTNKFIRTAPHPTQLIS